MKNLKRVLSLALSGIMLVGMMAVGASAVDAKDFTDAAEIQNTDAVNTMVALNVINGKDTGAFDPKGTVTRAEMAKMITVALNGGKDFTYGTKPTPTYTDIKGHWAESYIEYCSATGIIAGQGDGTFAPANTVTGSQAAKMILTAIGYDAAGAGMIGVDWEINTNVLAGQKDLYKDLSINPSEPLNRDDAAQMLYNGVRATMVEYTYNAQTVNGTLTMVPQVKEKTHFVNGTEVKTTVLTEKFGMSEAEGILCSVEYVEAAGKEPEKFVYKVNEDGNVVDAGSDTITTFKADTTDYSFLLGEKVNALYKIENGQRVLYGVYGKSDDVAVISQGQIDRKSDGTIDGTKKSIKADGTTYSLTDKANTVKYYTYDSASGDLVAGNEIDDLNSDVDPVSTVKLVCNSATGKFEYAIVTPAKVAKITFKSASSVTMNNGVGAYDIDDITIYDDAKKNDFVIFTSDAYTVKGVADIAKTETVSGKVEAMRNTSDIRVDGTWYKKGGAASAPGINDDVTLVVVGGYYYDADATAAKSIDNVLFVAEAKDQSTVGDGKVEASVAFADGSIEVIRISKVNDTDAAVATSSETYGTDDKVFEGAMYTYDRKSSGVYELTALADTSNNDRAGYEKFAAGTEYKTSTTTPKIDSTYFIADDAVVFVRCALAGSTKTQVITGAELKDWSSDWGTSSQVLANKVSGNMTAQVVALYSAAAAVPGSQGGKSYGLVLADAYYVKDGSSYAQMSIWNGEDEISVKAEKVWNDTLGTPAQATPADNVNTWAAAKKGAFVEYETLKNGNITNVKVVGTAAALVGEYKDRDNNVTLTFENDACTASGSTAAVEAQITNKTQIIYVNGDAKADGSDYELATETAISDYYIKNVVYAYTSGSPNKLDVLFVDVTNCLKTNSDAKALTVGSGLTGVGVVDGTLYTNSQTVAVTDVKVVAAGTAAGSSEIVSAGALALTVTASNGATPGTNLAAGDVITVVAADGSTASYIVNTGAMPS